MVIVCRAEPIEARIGVLALRGKERCSKMWDPTAAFLSKNIPEYSFKIVPLDFSEVDDAVKSKKVDFILVNSSMYVMLELKYGANRIVTMKKDYKDYSYNVFGGVIFCLKCNTNLNTIADLKGKSFMAADETSFGGWQMPLEVMLKEKFNPFRSLSSLQFGGTHDDVVMAVKSGKVDAGTARSGILESMDKEKLINLSDFKIIHNVKYPLRRFPFLCSTPLYPEWPLSQLPHAPEALVEQVTVTLMQMKQGEAASIAAGIAGWSSPLNYNSVNECLKYLRVGPYKDYGRITFAVLWKTYWHWFILGISFGGTVLAFSIYAYSSNRRLRTARTIIEKELAERKRAEEEIRQIFNTSGDGMRVLSSERKILEVNARYVAMTGYSRDELVGSACKDFSSCDDERCNSDLCTLKHTIETGERVEIDFMLKTRFSSIPCAVTSVPYYNSQGKIIGVIQNFKDISDRLRVEDAAAQAAEQRGKALMASSVLHDIGNAVTGIGTIAVKNIGDAEWPEIQSLSMLHQMFKDQQPAFAQALGEDKAGKLVVFVEKLEDSMIKRKNYFIEVFRKMANSISHINDVLSLQRTYAGNRLEASTSVSITNLAQDSVAMLSASLQKRNISVHYNVPPDLPEIKVDKTRIIQVLINLVKNAAESFDEESEDGNDRFINIALRREGETLIIEIEDNASGFDKTVADKLFQNGFSTKSRGSGIGLYQCRSIIESHGGKISIISPGIGKGATAMISLPFEIKKS